MNDCKEMTKVSVLIPVYNVQKYLPECLNSVINQTYKSLEIICVNDGSTDNSLEILRQFENKDDRIVVIDKKNSGYGATMNRALQNAHGDYISIVESDDYIESDMIEKLLEWAVTNDTDIVMSGFYKHSDDGDEYSTTLNPEHYKYDEVICMSEEKPFFFMGGGTIWTGLYKRSFLEKNSIIFNETPGASYQDTGFKFISFAMAKRILLNKAAFYHYRVDNSNSSVKSDKKIFCVCDEMDFIKRYIENNSVRPFVKYWFETYKYNVYKWNYLRIAHEYKMSFLTRVHDEFMDDDRNGLIREEDFDELSWCDLKKILYKWDEYFTHKDEIIRQTMALEKELVRSRSIYIYGAGEYGKDLLGILTKRNEIPRAFLVSSKNTDPDSIGEIPVIEFDNQPDKEKDAILIAVSPKYLTEITDKIKESGYENYCIVNYEIMRLM